MNIVAARWVLTTGAPSTARHVLLVLACHANQAGCAWPSVDTLADETGLSDRAVQKSLSVLERLALVTLERRPGKSTRYTLDIHRGVNVVRPQGVNVSRKGVNLSAKGVNVVHPMVLLMELMGVERPDPRLWKTVARPSCRVPDGSMSTGAAVTVTTRGDATFLPGTGWVQPALEDELQQREDERRRRRQRDVNAAGVDRARQELRAARARHPSQKETP